MTRLLIAVAVLCSICIPKHARAKGAPVLMMAVSSVFADSRRRAYNQAVKMVEEAGNYVVNDTKGSLQSGKTNIRMAQSFICSEIPLTSSSTSYVLNVIDQQYNIGNTNLLPGELRVKQQDVFFTYAIGFFVRFNVQGWQGESQVLNTFPDPAIVGALPNFYPDASALLGIWTYGRLNVTVGGDVLTPAWDLSQHLVINQTMGNTGGVPSNPYFNQVNLAEDGYAIAEPNWIINGGNNNQYQVTYPNNYNNIFGGVNAGSTVQTSLVMKLSGFLAQNASSIMDNASAKPVK